jgi:RimJ/RimL family protein N-acetyltransferase
MNREPLAIRLETPHHIVRTVERADANESFAKWLLDPEAARQLNSTPRAMTMDTLRKYIDSFDRVKSHLLGIFDKETGRLVGIRSIYVNHDTREFYDNILIGEVDARGKHARSESTDAIQPYFFETLGLEASVCSVLAHNKLMLDIVARKGWERVRSEMKPSAEDGRPIEVYLYRLSRETWRRKMRERETKA